MIRSVIKNGLRNPNWGWIPLIAAIYTTVFEFTQGNIAHALWICNIGNVFLGLGILFRIPLLTWSMTLWIIIGTPLWIWDNIERGDFLSIHAFFIHVVSAFVGVLVIKNHEKVIRVWGLAGGFGLVVVVLSRWLTPAELNVNMSSAIYPPLATLFSSYTHYFMFNVVSFAVSLFVLERLLERILISHDHD